MKVIAGCLLLLYFNLVHNDSRKGNSSGLSQNSRRNMVNKFGGGNP